MSVSFADDSSKYSQVKKRKRPSLVCENCKKKKIRCDKGQPCAPCVKARLVDSCRYDSSITSRQSATKDAEMASLPYVSSAKNPIAFSSKQEEYHTQVPTKKRRSDTSSDNVTISIAELNMLKERINQIESSIQQELQQQIFQQQNQLQQQPQQSPQYQVQHPPQQSFSTFSASNTTTPPLIQRNAPIQLPPLQFRQVLPPAPTQPARNSANFNESNSRSTSYSDSAIRSQHSSRSSHSNGRGQSTGTSSSSINAFSYPSIPNTPRDSFQGLNPYQDEEERINFYSDYTSIHIKEPDRRINFGPFAWSSFMKKDTGLRLLWDFILKKKEEKSQTAMIFAQSTHEITQENTNVITSNGASTASGSEASFKKRALEVDGYIDMIPYKSIIKERVDKNIQKSKLNENNITLGLTVYDGQINRELQLIEKIQMILPKKKVIWKLIRRYFTWLYPFMPFIDQETFMTKTAKLIGPESYEDVKIPNLVVEKRLDLADLGLLLVILRLAYLTLFCNNPEVNDANLKSMDPSPKAQEIKFLLNNPINITTVDVAHECLNQFQLFRKTSLPIFQLAFYIRLYHVYAPEDGDGADGGDSQVLSAVLIQMAYSLGLNREPNKFNDVLNNPKLNHLGRKLWNYLIIGDLHQSYSFGNPLTIEPIYYDTKVPKYEEGSENISDVTLDKYVTDSYIQCGATSVVLRKVLVKILNVEEGANMSCLCKSMTELENLIAEQYGTLEECLKPLEQNEHWFVFTRNFRTKFYLALKTFCVSMYYHFYLHYEVKNIQLSFFYLKKMLSIGAFDIMPHYFDLLGYSDVICDFIINPTLEQIIHKLNQLNLAVIIRVNFIIYNMKRQPDHISKVAYDSKYGAYYRALCRLSSCLTRTAEVSVAAISKISNRYYYAWRITKGHTYLLKNITTMEFYDENYENASNLCTPYYTLDQIEELITICETSLTKLGKVDLMGNEFCNEARTTPQDTNLSSNSTNNLKTGSVAKTKDGISASGTTPAAGEGKPNEISLDFVDSKEIDNLWFQMLAMKHDNQLNDNAVYPSQAKGESRKPSFNFGSFSPSGYGAGTATNGETPKNVLSSPYPSGQALGGDLDRFGFDMEQAMQFDIFSELPFDQVFKTEN
ncbi:fungal transcriptional regulatory protein [Scheffersomyces xylosifermentans]|uniref:fungal transcriptional regulatory protein n=1 Tax=Scheffersomyces xylosifermentans TaxID=1304137 RepID=UPI00315DDB74